MKKGQAPFHIFLAGVCLIAWASPILVSGDSPHSGTVPFSLRVSQRADDRAGLEELSGALTAGLEKRVELAPELTQIFRVGQLPAEEIWSKSDFTQRVVEQVAVELIDRGYRGLGKDEEAVRRTEFEAELARVGQEIQSEFAAGERIQIAHTAFGSKGLIAGAIGPGEISGDRKGEPLDMISDVADPSGHLLLDEPGVGSYAVTGPGVTSLGRFPERARALVVAIQVDPKRLSWRAIRKVFREHNVNTAEELFDPELQAAELVQRAAKATGVEIGQMDVTLIDAGQSEEVKALERLRRQPGNEGMGLNLIAGGTTHEAIPAILGRSDGRVSLFIRRAGVTPALWKTLMASAFSREGSFVAFRVVSDQIRSGFDRRYQWDPQVEEELRELRAEDARVDRIPKDDSEEILNGKKIFSSRQVRGRVKGSFTFLTQGRGWSGSVPGVTPAEEDRYHVWTLSFQSPFDRDRPGTLWATKTLRAPRRLGATLEVPGLLSSQALGAEREVLLQAIHGLHSNFIPLESRQRLGRILSRNRPPPSFLDPNQERDLLGLLEALGVSGEPVALHGSGRVRRMAVRWVEADGPLFRTASGRWTGVVSEYDKAQHQLTIWLPKPFVEAYFHREDTRATTQLVLFSLLTEAIGLTDREALLVLGFYNSDATLPGQSGVAIPDALRAVVEILHARSLSGDSNAGEATRVLRDLLGQQFRLTETERNFLKKQRRRSEEETARLGTLSRNLAGLIRDWGTGLLRQFDRFLIVRQEEVGQGYQRYQIDASHRAELDALFGTPPSPPEERYSILLKEGQPIMLLREDRRNFTLKGWPYSGFELETQLGRDRYREALLAYAHLQTVQTGHLLLVYEERGDRIGLVLRDDERFYAVNPKIPGRKFLPFQLGDLEGQRWILGDPTQMASSERQFQLEFKLKDSKQSSMLVEIEPPDKTFGRGPAFLVVPKKTVLVVGYGTIGSKVARQLTRFGFDVVVANRGVKNALAARNHGFSLYFLQDYAIADPAQRQKELGDRQKAFRKAGIPWNQETLESLLERGGADLIVNAIDKNTQPFLKELYSLSPRMPVILQGGDKSEWADVVVEPTVHEVLRVPFTPYRTRRVFKCPSCNETFGSHLLAAAGLIPDLAPVSGEILYMRRHADPYASKSDLAAEGPKIQPDSHHAQGIVEVFEAIPEQFRLPFRMAQRTGRPDLTSTATTGPQTKAHQSVATLDLRRKDGSPVDLNTYNQALAAMGTVAAIGFGKEFEPGPILEVAVEQYGALHPFALHPIGTQLSGDKIKAIGLTPQESNVVTGNLELIIALTGLIPDEDHWRFINGLVQHVQDITSRKRVLERTFRLEIPGRSLDSPPVWPPLSTRERFAQFQAGLEEDPLLEIWQRNQERPAFMDPLETHRLLEEWGQFGPLVKSHLENPNSPIPHFLLWNMLLSENWERAMENRPPLQWIWLADQILPRWKGREESSDRAQRRQDLLLLAALDRLLLIRAQEKDVSTGVLIARHRRILAAWNRELSRGDPHRLSEELVVSLLKSLKEAAELSPRRRELFWTRVERQRIFEWIQKAWAQKRRPTPWEASHLTPEHFPLLAELPRKEQEALFESVLPKLLHRSPSGYDSMGDIAQAASFVDFWMAAESRPELKGAFLAGLAKNPVKEILDPLLEIAADYPELRTPVLRFLAVLLNLKEWFFTDQDLPWVNLLYLMNRIEAPEQHLWMQEVNRLLLKGYSGKIGVPRSSPLRPFTKPLEDPDSFGPDLNGFIRREAHHVGGAHVLDLVRLRLHWWATGDKTPLVEYLGKLHTAEARETLSWLADRETAPEAEELHPALQQVLGNRAVEFLATVEEADLKSARRDLEEKGVPGLNRLFDREIPLFRHLWQMYAPRSAEAALEAIQNLHKDHQSMVGWPGEELERFLVAFRGEDRLAALQALAELHSAVRQGILQASRYPKWGTSHHEFYQREYDATSEVHHGIPAVRGYDPRNLNFQLYILLEYVRPLAGQWAGQLIRQAQQEPGWPAQANLLKGFLQWLKATGPGSQPLEDLLELAGSENLTLARLQLIGKQLLIYLDQMAARQDEQIGETIDAVAAVLQEEGFHPEVLESMGVRELPPGRIWEPRLRPHLERQILAHREAVAATRTFATLLTGRLNPLGERELLRPIQTGSGQSQKAPEWWVPLTASIAGSGGLEYLGNKFRNLMLLHQWGHPVPPAVGFPIGKGSQGVIQRMKEGVAQVEGQIQDRNLQAKLGARFADTENPLLLSVRSGALVDLPGQLATLENVGIRLSDLPALKKRIGSWAAWDAYRRFIQDFAVSVYGSRRGFTPELFDRIIEGYKRKAGVEKKIQLSAEQMQEVALKYDQAVRSLVQGGIPEDPWEQLKLAIQAVVDSWDQPYVQPIREIFGLQHEKGTAVILQAMIHGNFSRLVNGAEGHERSGAGVAFVSLDGDVPGKGSVGSFGQGAQGSDVADGVITPEPLSRLEELMPEVFKELQDRARDIQEKDGEEREIEFTVQNEELWFLQDRSVPIRGWAPEFNREAVEASIPLGRGTGLSGGAVRGILAFPKSLENPVRLDQLNRLAAERGVEGLLLAMDTATPEDTRFLRMPGVQGFFAHRGGPGQHEGMIATLLGLTAVAGLSGMELDRDNPAGGVSFHADFLKKDPGVYLKEGDLVSVDGFRGAVYPGKLPLATEPSDAPAAGLEENRAFVQEVIDTGKLGQLLDAGEAGSVLVLPVVSLSSRNDLYLQVGLRSPADLPGTVRVETLPDRLSGVRDLLQGEVVQDGDLIVLNTHIVGEQASEWIPELDTRPGRIRITPEQSMRASAQNLAAAGSWSRLVGDIVDYGSLDITYVTVGDATYAVVRSA